MEQPPDPYRFGPFEFAPRSGDLARGGRRVRLQPQPGRLLAFLLSRPGELVTREEIQRELWPDTRVEFDQGLNFCIRQIRSALGDTAARSLYLETLPRRGYRFIAPVTRVADDAPPPSGPPAAEPVRTPPRRRPVWRWVAAALALAGAAALALAHVRDGAPRVAVLPFDVDSADAGSRAAGDLLAEALVAELSRGGPDRIGVLGPSSTRGMGGYRSPVRPIQEALGVDHVLSGRVRLRGDSLRAFVQLVRTEDGVHLWAEVYERPAARLPAIAREAAGGVRRELEAR